MSAKTAHILDKCERFMIMFKKSLRWPGIEPGSTAWKAAMLTTIPPTLHVFHTCIYNTYVKCH